MTKQGSGFACMECGKKFRTIKGAEKASSIGCPKCGGVDIDLASPGEYRPSVRARVLPGPEAR